MNRSWRINEGDYCEKRKYTTSAAMFSSGEGRICWLNCGVLAEAAFHLGSSAYLLTLLEDEMVRIAFDCNRHLGRLKELALRYEDRNPDLADLCLIRMSEFYPKYPVVTVDEADFRIYRRNKRDIVPTISPPR